MAIKHSAFQRDFKKHEYISNNIMKTSGEGYSLFIPGLPKYLNSEKQRVVILKFHHKWYPTTLIFRGLKELLWLWKQLPAIYELNVSDLNWFPSLLYLPTTNNEAKSMPVLTWELPKRTIAKHCGNIKCCGTRSIMYVGFLPVALEKEKEFDDSWVTI